MKIAVVTIFPEMFTALTDAGVIGRAIQNSVVDIRFYNPRDFSDNKHKTVDDRPYGGGPGMLMMAKPLLAALRAAKLDFSSTGGEKTLTVYLSPQGQPFQQSTAAEAIQYDNLLFVCGRYEGIDERIIQLEIDVEWSLGDYVLSGGELPAMVIIDTITRLLPKALGHEQSAEQDSFSEGLLDYPHYTRPENIESLAVPSVLLSGDHQAIEQWRRKQALGRTWQRRPELLEAQSLSKQDAALLAAFKTDAEPDDT